MKAAQGFRMFGAACAALALLVAPAQAKEEAPAQAPTIAMEAVALPVIADGKLLNYIFVSIKLELSPKSDGSAVRAKEQFFRDDLVRVGHRTPFTLKNDYNKVDEVRVKAEVMRAAAGFVGPGQVKTVLITKQVPQKILGKPEPPRPKTPEIIP
jgi:hypothetical protein